MLVINRDHKGVILNNSKAGFDHGGATFPSVFYEEAAEEYFMFYTGASDTKWSKASIGLAISSDGLNFKKLSEPVLDPENFNLKKVVTSTIFRVGNHFYMAFAGSPLGREERRIYLAYSDDLRGPWRFIKTLIKPRYLWEGNGVDLGSSTVKLSEDEVLIYYSNVSNKPWERLFKPKYWLSPTFWLRRIGILKLRVRSPNNIEVYGFNGNPLKHLNGPKGSWNESLFCPGYFRINSTHHLLPAGSTYSIGFPYRQYIGLIEDTTPYFSNPTKIGILIDGPKEKRSIIPDIRSEIALDTPCPIIREDKLWLYYAVMDRTNGIWRTALSIYSIKGN